MASIEEKDSKADGKKTKIVSVKISSPNARRKETIIKNIVSSRTLRLTLGMTCPNRNCFAVNPLTGMAVYPSSGVAVLLDTLASRQAKYIQASTQSISCLSFSPDGLLLLLGEMGHMPALRVWSLALDQQVSQFRGHEYGVAYSAFSGKMDLIASLGTIHDGTIFVWAWPSGEKISCNRFAEAIYSLSFSHIDPFFVTCGAHHIRFWYPDMKRSGFKNDTLLGRSVIMQDIKTRTYVDVSFGSDRSARYVYCVTLCGLVCKINSDRRVNQFHQLQCSELSSIQASDDRLVIGTIHGQVHFFNALTMEYRTTIAVPIDASISAPDLWGFMYLALDNKHSILTALLENGYICTWDIEDLNNINRRFFCSTHNKQVSAIDVNIVSHGSKRRSLDSLFSVSHDGTLRQCKISLEPHACCQSTKALYTKSYHSRDPTTCATEVMTTVNANPSIGLVVIGDSKGLVTVYEMSTFLALYTIQRHTRSVTIISFYKTSDGHKKTQLMLTAARDRIINVYDVKKDFQLLNSLSLHSGSISALAMLSGRNCLKLLSSARDRTVILSTTKHEDPFRFTPYQCRHTTSSVIAIQVCSGAKCVVLGRCNAVLTVLDASSFESLNTFRACGNPNGQLEKLDTDSLGALVVTACSDRTINVMSLPQGVRLACFTGHAMPVSGLLLFVRLRIMVTSSRDGCVFVWSLPNYFRRRAIQLLKISARKSRKKAKKIYSGHNSQVYVNEKCRKSHSSF